MFPLHDSDIPGLVYGPDQSIASLFDEIDMAALSRIERADDIPALFCAGAATEFAVRRHMDGSLWIEDGAGWARPLFEVTVGEMISRP